MDTSKEKADYAEIRYSDNTVRSYSGLEVQAVDEMTPLKAAPMLEAGGSPKDELDFKSGFTEQYHQEYGNKTDITVVHTNSNNNIYAWYKDPTAIAMVVFLLVSFFAGSILLVMLVFTRNPWKIALITLGYLMIAFLLIFTQVKTAIIR